MSNDERALRRLIQSNYNDALVHLAGDGPHADGRGPHAAPAAPLSFPVAFISNTGEEGAAAVDVPAGGGDRQEQ